MALEEIKNVDINQNAKSLKTQKNYGWALPFTARAYTVLTGITSLAIGSEVFYGVMGKLFHTLPFALNLGVSMTRALGSTVTSAGVALAVGAGTLYGIEAIGKSLDKNKQNKTKQHYNETQMGMNI